MLRFAVLFTLLALITSCQSTTNKTASTTSQQLPEILKGSKRLLFYGDSLTDGSSYPDYVVSSLNAVFPDAKFELENSALCGDEVKDLLQRYDNSIPTKKPDIVFICIGTNDASQKRPLKDYEADYKTLIGKLRKEGIKPIIMKPSPFGDEKRNKPFQAYQKTIEKIAKDENVPLIDVNSTFKIWMDAGRKVLGPDKCHHGEDGFECKARAILDGLGLKNVPVVKDVITRPGTLTNWQISNEIPMKEWNKTKDADAKLALAKTWTKYDPKSFYSKLPWYDKPFIDRGAVMPFGKAIGSKVALAKTTYDSAKGGKAVIEVGGAPPLFVYVNGKMVWDQKKARGYHPNVDRINVTLKKGKNEIIASGNYFFYLGIKD